MVLEILNNLDWSVLTNALLSIIPALICITIHELSHGFTAYKLGDRTAKNMGRLTLNPIKHIDIFGLVMMVIFKFGWAKPVPVDMRNFKRPKTGMAITAIAGPLSNVILAIVAMFAYGLVFTALGGYTATGAALLIRDALQGVAYLSVALAVFNLVPIPPLDGSKVLFSFFPDSAYGYILRYERFGIIALILILNTSAFSKTIGAVTMELYNRIFAVAQMSFELVNRRF